jgi:hypothetical protein
LQLLARERGIVGYRPDQRVLLDVEEVGRAQVLVALGISGVQAVRLDRQLDRRITGSQSMPS